MASPLCDSPRLLGRRCDPSRRYGREARDRGTVSNPNRRRVQNLPHRNFPASFCHPPPFCHNAIASDADQQFDASAKDVAHRRAPAGAIRSSKMAQANGQNGPILIAGGGIGDWRQPMRWRAKDLRSVCSSRRRNSRSSAPASSSDRISFARSTRIGLKDGRMDVGTGVTA